MFLLRLSCLCAFLALLVCGLSQSNAPQPAEAVAAYKEADAYYNEGLRLSTQSRVDEAKVSELNNKALTGYGQFLKRYRTQPTLDSFLFAAAVKAGELALYFDSLPQALHYYNTAIALKQKAAKRNDSSLFKPYIFAGLIYYNHNQMDSTLAFLKKAEEIQTSTPRRLSESERLYNILGSINYQYGNYKQAKNYFQKASEVLSVSNPSYRDLFTNYKMNIAASLLGLEQYDSARVTYQSLLLAAPSFSNQINNQLGLIELYSGSPGKALHYFRRVQYTGHLQLGLYSDRAKAYMRLQQFDSAHSCLQEAMTAMRDVSAIGNADYGRVLKTFGDWQKEQHHFDSALGYYQQALSHFYPAFRDTSISANPTLFSGAFSYVQCFQTLAAKAETLEALYQTEKKTDWAGQSLSTYRSAFALIEYVERTYESDEARLFLTKTIHSVHNGPINLAYTLYTQTNNKKYLSLVYLFDQKNKATVLSLNRQRASLLQESASPQAQKEAQLKAEITRLSIKAAQTDDSAELASLSSRIRDGEIELGKLQETINATTKFDEGRLPSLEDLQGLLNGKTALLSYHLSPGQLTTLTVTKAGVFCHQQALPQGFAATVQRQVLSLKTPASKTAFVQDSSLYNLFFTGVDFSRYTQLIIIPDDVLAYLPFESLQDGQGKFLVQKAAVQYQFSTALLGENKTNFSTAQTLSFAPFAHQSYTDSLPLLPASEQELAFAKGQKFFDSVATKEKFLQLSPDYQILHLATHAVANNNADALSYIVFSPTGQSHDNLLYAQEIYNLRLQKTGLVILSACETGAGNLAQGEGVLSLSRAFAYAGCPNIITSMWKADDFSTGYLTARIHRYLADGYSVAKAVQQAKIDYLADKDINPRLKHPYYWSHLLFIGNYSPEKSTYWLWIAAGLLLAASLLFFYKRKSRKRGRSIFTGGE